MFQIIILDYDAWMMFVYKDGEQIKYWCEGPNDWEQSWEKIGYMNPKEVIHLKFPEYEDVRSLEETLDNKDFFDMTSQDIQKLKSMML